MKSLDNVMRAAFLDNPSADREEIRADCLKRFSLKPNGIEGELFSFWFNKEYPGFVNREQLPESVKTEQAKRRREVIVESRIERDKIVTKMNAALHEIFRKKYEKKQ